MADDLKAASISHEALLRDLTEGVFDDAYISGDKIEGCEKPWPGHDFYHNRMNKLDPLAGRQLIPKTANLYRAALAQGYSKTAKGETAYLTPSELSKRLIAVLAGLPLGDIPALRLSDLTIGKDDGSRAAKAGELVLLLELALKALDRRSAATPTQLAARHMERAIFSEKEHLRISLDETAEETLCTLFARHNESALRRTGTYQLSEIVRELVPNISAETREALFRYNKEKIPLLQCIERSWEEEDRPNLMLVGEGGIGKTVAMLSASTRLCGSGVPALYVPLHALPFLNAPGRFLRNYVKRSIPGNSQAMLDSLQDGQARTRCGKPSLVLLLDGWNEINERKVHGNWLTEIIREEIESDWLESTNAQVIIAGRARMDPTGTWQHRWSYLKVQRLKEKNIRLFLRSAEVKAPPKDDPIWETLGNPLMLTLYACSAEQETNCKDNRCCKFIADERSSAQSAVIWNYLQCQINKACIISAKRGTAFPKILAINYAAAYIGWSMEEEGLFRITLGQLSKLIDEAGGHFELAWRNSRHIDDIAVACGIVAYGWDAAEIEEALLVSARLLIDESPDESLAPYEARGGARHSIGFLHQKFRDFYSALFMREELAPFGTLETPEESCAWTAKPKPSEILDLLAPLFDKDELGNLWSSTEGVAANDGSSAMFHVLEVLQRSELSLSSLSYSNRDLRFASLQNRGLNASNLRFDGARIGNRTLLPAGHSEDIAGAKWLPDSESLDGDAILTCGKTAIIWNARTGLPSMELVERENLFYSAVEASMDGTFLALAVEDQGFDLYDTIRHTTTRYQPRNSMFVYAISPIPNSHLVACGGEGSKAVLCNTKTGSETWILVPGDMRDRFKYRNVIQFACSADGAKMAILYDSGGMTLWAVNPNSLGACATFLGADDFGEQVNDIQLNKDGSMAMIMTAEADIYISETDDVFDWEMIDFGIEECDAMGMSFEHGLMAIAIDNRLCLYSMQDRQMYKSLTMATDLNSAAESVYMITFSPSGDKLVCVHENNIVTAWDTRPSFSGVEERPLFAVENNKSALSGVRALEDDSLLVSTGLKLFLKWSIDALRCRGCLTVGGINPDHWDVSADGRVYATVVSNLVRTYGSDGSKLASCKLKNRVQDIRILRRFNQIAVLDNGPSIVCLNLDSLSVVASRDFSDQAELKIAPTRDDVIVGLTENCKLLVHGIPSLEIVRIIDIWEAMARSDDDQIRGIGSTGTGQDCHPYISAPEFAQIECFDTSEDADMGTALVVAEVAGTEGQCFTLTVAIDLKTEKATMAYRDDPGDEITGIAVCPRSAMFFQTSLKGSVDARRLSDGEYVESVEPIPGIMLTDADFRNVEFESETLRDMVRASGAITD